MSKWIVWSGTDEQWDEQLLKFSNACVYQSSSWGGHRADFGWRVTRLIESTQNSGFAQILTKKVFGTTVAWIPGGPVGDLKNLDETFDQQVLGLTQSSRLYIRINSLEMTSQKSQQQLKFNNWAPVKNKFSTGVSLNYSLLAPEAIRRESLSSNWGRNLRRGETRNTDPYVWSNYTAKEIADVYTQLSEYKDLAPDVDTPSFETINSLINSCRNYVHLIRCDDEQGNPLAIRGALMFGEKAWDIFAAVTPQGRKQYSSYPTLWKLFNSCADAKISNYDLSGVDPIKNKGVYDFKHGTGATEINYLGEWDRGTPFFIRPLVGRLIGYRRNL
jgi:lipid II:glycine glycyltransferase (peptidoglycan interpeptide bridge formation enzyme)